MGLSDIQVSSDGRRCAHPRSILSNVLFDQLSTIDIALGDYLSEEVIHFSVLETFLL